MRKRIQKQVTVGPLTEKTIFIKCPTGYQLTGGGFAIGAIGNVYCSAPVSKTWLLHSSESRQGEAPRTSRTAS